LKARAALAGMSLSDYLLTEIREIAERPTLAELRDRLHKRKPVSAHFDTGLMVREEREARYPKGGITVARDSGRILLSL